MRQVGPKVKGKCRCPVAQYSTQKRTSRTMMAMARMQHMANCRILINDASKQQNPASCRGLGIFLLKVSVDMAQASQQLRA